MVEVFEECDAGRVVVFEYGEVVGECVGAEEACGVVVSARCCEQCLGEVGFADGGFAQDDKVLCALAPLAVSESGDLLFVDGAAGRVGDVFDASIGIWRSGCFEQFVDSPLTLGRYLFIECVEHLVGEAPVVECGIGGDVDDALSEGGSCAGR